MLFWVASHIRVNIRAVETYCFEWDSSYGLTATVPLVINWLERRSWAQLSWGQVVLILDPLWSNRMTHDGKDTGQEVIMREEKPQDGTWGSSPEPELMGKAWLLTRYAKAGSLSNQIILAKRSTINPPLLAWTVFSQIYRNWDKFPIAWCQPDSCLCRKVLKQQDPVAWTLYIPKETLFIDKLLREPLGISCWISGLAY